MIKKITLLSILFIFYGYFQGQVSGSLDSSFGTGGKTNSTHFVWQSINQIATQADGKIIAVGQCATGSNNRNFYVVRYNSNGSIDTTFASSGFLNFDVNGGSYYDEAQTVKLQADGKILVGGVVGTVLDRYYLGVIRLNQNGTIDTTFGNQGKSLFTMTGFTTSSVLNFRLSDIALQSDGKIVVAGLYNYKYSVARLNTDGSLDLDFSNDGKVTIDFGSSSETAEKIKILSDSRILIGGSSNPSVAAWCMLQPDGSLDTSFGTGGKRTFTPDSSFEFGTFFFLPDNSILVGGSISINGNNRDAALYKLSINGTRDTTFGTNGRIVVDVDNSSSDSNIAKLDIDRTGKIYAVGTTQTGGSSYFYLLNFNNNGTLNPDFSFDGKVLVNFGGISSYGQTVLIQPNGRVLVAGYTGGLKDSSSIARFVNSPSLMSTAEIVLGSKLSISPNPATDYFMISDTKKIANQKVEILDELGRIVKILFVSENNSRINISDLSSGVYLVKVNNITTKLIVK